MTLWRDGTEAAIALGDSAGAGRLCPDAWFTLRLDRQGTVLLCLVEVDRGTERGTHRWDEKLAGYGTLFDGDRAALRTATGYDKARVLVVAPDARRRDALAEQVRERSRVVYPRLGWLAGRFWIAEERALRREGPVQLAGPIWRQPGSQALAPAVPTAVPPATPAEYRTMTAPASARPGLTDPVKREPFLPEYPVPKR